MNGIEVSKIRFDLNLTQTQFGKLLGVDRRTIANYEQGKTIPENQQKLIRLIYEQKKDGKNSLKEPESTYEKISEEKENDSIVLQREILDLKDHIKTLKEFLKEKTVVCDMYKDEIERLKAIIEGKDNHQNRD